MFGRSFRGEERLCEDNLCIFCSEVTFLVTIGDEGLQAELLERNGMRNGARFDLRMAYPGWPHTRYTKRIIFQLEQET